MDAGVERRGRTVGTWGWLLLPARPQLSHACQPHGLSLVQSPMEQIKGQRLLVLVPAHHAGAAPAPPLKGMQWGCARGRTPSWAPWLVGKDAPGPHGLPTGQASSLPSPGSQCLHPLVLHVAGSSISDLAAHKEGTDGEDSPRPMAAWCQGLVQRAPGRAERSCCVSGTAVRTLPTAACL